MQLNLSTLENEQIISRPHYKDHKLQKHLNAPLSMLAVRLDDQRRAVSMLTFLRSKSRREKQQKHLA